VLLLVRWCQSMQRNRFDRAAKDMLRASLEPDGAFAADEEIASHPQHADGWFTPDPARPPTRAALGLLGRMTSDACTLEAFHATPGENDVSDCVRKLLTFRHVLTLRTPAPPPPRLWIISSGRPVGGLEGFAFHSRQGWPNGVYHSPRLLFAGLVVTSELPRARDTLLLRLMGAGACLRDALAELATMPREARERAIAGPVLLRCRIDVPEDPASRTSEDEEFMTSTQEIFEAWEREKEAAGLERGLEQGRAEGRTEGLAEAVVMIYETHFGAMPAELKTIVETTEKAETLQSWLRLVESSSVETFATTVLASRAG
jgi:hypothetical protein